MSQRNSQGPQSPIQNAAPTKESEAVAVDGFQQVLEMLKIADPEFRESLLRRLAARDRELARSLRDDLASL